MAVLNGALHASSGFAEVQRRAAKSTQEDKETIASKVFHFQIEMS
jgi:hypothetical protein